MVFICIAVLSIVCIASLLRLFGNGDFFNRTLTFFYILSNMSVIMLLYFVSSYKFSFIVQMIMPLMVINVLIVLVFQYAQLKDDGGGK